RCDALTRHEGERPDARRRGLAHFGPRDAVGARLVANHLEQLALLTLEGGTLRRRSARVAPIRDRRSATTTATAATAATERKGAAGIAGHPDVGELARESAVERDGEDVVVANEQ